MVLILHRCWPITRLLRLRCARSKTKLPHACLTFYSKISPIFHFAVLEIGSQIFKKMTSSPSQILELCAHLNTLKHLRRTGWVKCGVVEPETVASHMYRMAMLGWFINQSINQSINRSAMTLPDTATYTSSYLTEMCLVHDVAECIVGDITPHCGVSNEDKHTREKNVCFLLNIQIDWLIDWLIRRSIKSAHCCHQQRAITGRSYGLSTRSTRPKRQSWHTIWTNLIWLFRFVRLIFFQIKLRFQAFEYEMHGHGVGKLQQFFDSTENVFRTELVKSWVVGLKAKRELTISNANWYEIVLIFSFCFGQVTIKP